jgi:hypothetical protein
MQQCVVINDAALGSWRLHVRDVCKHTDGTYAFEDYTYAEDLHTGEVCNDAAFLQMLAEYALDEGYKEQNISLQCSVLYAAYMQHAS